MELFIIDNKCKLEFPTYRHHHELAEDRSMEGSRQGGFTCFLNYHDGFGLNQQNKPL